MLNRNTGIPGFVENRAISILHMAAICLLICTAMSAVCLVGNRLHGRAQEEAQGQAHSILLQGPGLGAASFP